MKILINWNKCNNEDRHTHNIAVLLDYVGAYHYCPIFDHGAALLSDTRMDYPEEVKTRVLDIVMSQRWKYQYLF